MINLSTNWLPIAASAIASMVLGFVWYSKVLFGQEWAELTKIPLKEMTPKKGAAKVYLLGTISAFVTAFVLKQFIDLFYIVNVMDALQLAFWIWFGFCATVLLTGVLYKKESWKLFIINAGYQLASLMAMAAIFSYWQ